MKKILIILFIALAGCIFASCEKDTNERVTGGKPEVSYVRALSVEKPDNLVEGEFLGARLAIIGKGLAGVDRILFNDVPAVLNPAYVTETSIIVSIPSTIPGVKEDLLKLYTSEDSCIFNFEVKVPSPAINSMKCEWLTPGNTAYISGQYFVDDPTSPLTVTFTGGALGTIEEASLDHIAVKVPQGAQAGPVTVSSVYGTTKSPFWFRDNRNIILNFNNGEYPDYDYYFGWHGANGVSSENGINGNYLILSGAEMTDATWNDGKFGYEVWTYLPTDPDFFDVSKIDNYVLKFECRVPAVWSAAALQIIFTGASDVMLNWQNGNGLTFNSRWGSANGYLSDTGWPRILWNPWAASGSYQNNNWITVTIPMKECKYSLNGGAASINGAGHYSGITLFVNGGGVAGTPCNPVIHIDNVRIVPAK